MSIGTINYTPPLPQDDHCPTPHPPHSPYPPIPHTPTHCPYFHTLTIPPPLPHLPTLPQLPIGELKSNKRYKQDVNLHPQGSVSLIIEYFSSLSPIGRKPSLLSSGVFGVPLETVAKYAPIHGYVCAVCYHGYVCAVCSHGYVCAVGYVCGVCYHGYVCAVCYHGYVCGVCYHGYVCAVCSHPWLCVCCRLRVCCMLRVWCMLPSMAICVHHAV